MMESNRRPDCGQYFYSKRNKVVYDCEKACVKKVFAREEDYRNEKRVYEELIRDSSLRIPKILEADDAGSVLWLEYLEDSTLLTVLMEDESRNDMEAAIDHMTMLFEWLEGFYRVTGYQQVMSDVNFRNFILHGDMLYGFDFETVVQGDPREEKHMVLAMYLMYDPKETDFKEEVCQRMLDILAMDEECWKKIGNCIRAIQNRRREYS